VSLKKNIIANYCGQGWTALMGLVFLPVYIRYLGIEAYALIGLFVVLQAWLSLLDMGMTPTLNREMARHNAGKHSPQSICNLLRSMEVVCFSIAVLIAIGVWSSSGYLANDWLKTDKLPTQVVSQAISVMAFVAALRFIEGVYRGSLFGLQKQVWYNSVSAIIATVRNGGAVAVLAWVLPTVEVFFLWQAVVSVISIIVLAAGVHRTLPEPPEPPKFSRQAIAEVWKFAGGMMGITFLAILLTQVDKIMLSRMLMLKSFGYYSLAATVAGILYTIVGPITAAIYPHLIELIALHDQTELVAAYHKGAQLVTILTAPAVMLIYFFAGGIVFMWSGNADLAANTAPILTILVLGSFLNCLMHMPSQLQLAHGWTSLTLKTNAVAVLLLIPAIYWVVPLYGAVGAAWIWVALNSGYVLIAVQFMHQRIIPNEKLRWYYADLLLPIGGSIGVMLFATAFQPESYHDRWHWFSFLLITGVLALVASTALAGHIRPRLLSIIGRSRRSSC